MANLSKRTLLVLTAVLALAASPACLAAGSHAARITVNAAPINFYVAGRLATPSGGNFVNQGTVTVPDAFVYDKTTYVPIRLAAQLLGQPLQWNSAEYGVDITTTASPSSPPFTAAAVPAPTQSKATQIEVEIAPIHFYVDHADRTPRNGLFVNQGTVSVPDAIIYDKTTYVPIRLAASLLGRAISWDGDLYAVVIGRAPLTLLAIARGGSEDSVIEWHPASGEWTVMGGVPNSADLKAGNTRGLFYGQAIDGLACAASTSDVVIETAQKQSTSLYSWDAASGSWSPLASNVGSLRDPIFTPVGNLFAIGSGNVYERSGDGSWADLGSPGSGETVSIIAYDASTGGLVAATTDNGVYALDLPSGRWTPLGRLPETPSALAVDPKTGAMATVTRLGFRMSGTV